MFDSFMLFFYSLKTSPTKESETDYQSEDLKVFRLETFLKTLFWVSQLCFYLFSHFLEILMGYCCVFRTQKLFREI